ncbi:hypothetical protein CSUI_008311 [Cystoisospora suis]|uniref:Uncharacterized protein n=1 Tax=Cystoisospora suis TaxID=483139 RepID=A0A2C6KL68_9APIC|nr:hypothetical protein CSUI_008311 [Cystoisospora suis]
MVFIDSEVPIEVSLWSGRNHTCSHKPALRKNPPQRCEVHQQLTLHLSAAALGGSAVVHSRKTRTLPPTIPASATGFKLDSGTKQKVHPARVTPVPQRAASRKKGVPPLGHVLFAFLPEVKRRKSVIFLR